MKMMPDFIRSTKEYLSGTYHVSSTVLRICSWKEKAPIFMEHQFQGGTIHF